MILPFTSHSPSSLSSPASASPSNTLFTSPDLINCHPHPCSCPSTSCVTLEQTIIASKDITVEPEEYDYCAGESDCESDVDTEGVDMRQLVVDYPVKYVDVNVCANLYNEWRDQKKSLYKKIGNDGLPVHLEYADNINTPDSMGKMITDSCPTVLCLHGAPGSHKDFRHLIKHLSSMGHRVIVPNFPTYKMTTKTRVFRHSAQEKKEYIRNFLQSINVTKIDMLVSHSSAVYPSVLLWADESSPEIKSIALINPSGHRRIKAMKPKIVTSVFVRVYQNKLGRGVCRTFGSTVLGITGCPVRPDNMDNVLLSATTMVYSKFRHLQRSLDMLREQKVPILLILSENDKLVDSDISYEMANILGAEESSFSFYNEYSTLEKERSTITLPRVVVLTEGGHYSFVNHPKVVNNEIVNFFHSVLNNNEGSVTSQDEDVNQEMVSSPIESTVESAVPIST